MMSAIAFCISPAPSLFISNNSISSPPELPNPGIAGGFIENIIPDCICEVIAFALSTIANTVWFLFLRSFHGFNTTNNEPPLEEAPPPIKEKPEIAMTSSTSGIERSCCSTSFTTFSVRSSDAPLGNWTDVIK